MNAANSPVSLSTRFAPVISTVSPSSTSANRRPNRLSATASRPTSSTNSAAGLSSTGGPSPVS